jgi:bifunctional DNA-binding transcriptional regulator/antitoxin component of YhaV-PrlF toxin-antitoxin module
MSCATSTITSKWQVTIPEEVRSELPLRIGQRISWEVEGDRIIGRRVRSARELAGSLSKLPEGQGSNEVIKSALGKSALARQLRISKSNK